MKVIIKSKGAFEVPAIQMNSFIRDVSECMSILKGYGVEVEATLKIEK